MLNTSLVLFNADWASNNPQPLAPHFVSCGAMSAKPAQPLPPDLASLVETALQGVVYASLGTTIIPGMRLRGPQASPVEHLSYNMVVHQITYCKTFASYFCACLDKLALLFQECEHYLNVGYVTV